MGLMALVVGLYRHPVGDRRPEAPVQIEETTGLPEDPGVRVSRDRALGGRGLALASYFIPSQVAAGFVRRTLPGGETQALVHVAPSEWTEDEVGWVRELEHRIKLLAHRLAERGFVDVRPPGYEEGERMPLHRDDGMTTAFRFTHAGLEHALQRVRGTRWETAAPTTIRADLSPEQWTRAPQWAQQEGR